MSRPRGPRNTASLTVSSRTALEGSLHVSHHPTCRPDPQLGKYGHTQETPRQTLIREALEYQDIYHRDKGSAAGLKEARVQQILDEIEATGSYTHTADELEHGARVAWR